MMCLPPRTFRRIRSLEATIVKRDAALAELQKAIEAVSFERDRLKFALERVEAEALRPTGHKMRCLNCQAEGWEPIMHFPDCSPPEAARRTP